MEIVNKISIEQLIEIYEFSHKLEEKHKLRIGQSFMNALFEVSPETHNEISGTEISPFNDDTLLEECILSIVGVKIHNEVSIRRQLALQWWRYLSNIEKHNYVTNVIHPERDYKHITGREVEIIHKWEFGE